MEWYLVQDKHNDNNKGSNNVKIASDDNHHTYSNSVISYCKYEKPNSTACSALLTVFKIYT